MRHFWETHADSKQVIPELSTDSRTLSSVCCLRYRSKQTVQIVVDDLCQADFVSKLKIKPAARSFTVVHAF